MLSTQEASDWVSLYLSLSHYLLNLSFSLPSLPCSPLYPSILSLSLLIFSLLPPTGTPALTSRGMKEEDIGQVTQFLHEGILLTQQAKTDHEASVKTAASGTDTPAKPTTKVSGVPMAPMVCL